jgi:bisphosphoglycerate-dependent phosphoglycerate mutase family 1
LSYQPNTLTSVPAAWVSGESNTQDAGSPVQRRAIATADLALAACGRAWVPVRRSGRLNSNYYGALKGRSKAEVRAEAVEERFTAWRRGFRVRPPLGEPDNDSRYAALPPDAWPRGESLHDVTVRLLPYWCDAIVPDLYRRGCVLVTSHGSTLRALVKHLEVGRTPSSATGVVSLTTPVVVTALSWCFGACRRVWLPVRR